MNQDRTSSTRTTQAIPSDVPAPSVAAQIGPRQPGVVYYDGPRLVEVTEVITDQAEAKRVLRRNAAKFAILVRDLHAGTEDYIGAIWTGSDRVLKAVA